MSLVTVQRSPSPSNSPESDDGAEGEVSEDLDDSSLKSPGRQRSFSESYFAVKGAVLILPQSDVTDHTYTQKIVRERHAGVGTVTGDIQSHLQSMFYLLRSYDTIKVAVKLESQHEGHNRYMAVVSCFGKQDTEESVILGIDCNKEATIGLVLPIWADTSVNLNGDGGFMVSSEGKQHIFKPVSVQAMWSALQSLNKVVKISRDNMYIPRGLTHTWVGYYNSRIHSDRACISEWFTSEELEDWRSCNVLFMDPGDSPDDVLQKKIKTELKNIMMTVDLDEVTSIFLREALEEKLKLNLKSHKQFVEQEMITIMGLMDSPTMIKDFLFLGSEFNASNLEELTENGVDHILNISREVDNFFPEILTYMNIKEWDNEEADLCKHWDDTNKFIAKARRENSKVLVHCKMGISRSASTVMAYLMKEYGMSRREAYDFVKAKRACVMPNQAFWAQLLIYEGILNASKQRALFKSKSEQNLIPTYPTVKEEEEEEEILMKGHRLIKDDLCLPLLPPHDVLHDSVFLRDKDKDIMFDLESSSRSADSTEESLDLPSPKADAVVKSTAYGVYVIESNKLSPGDGPDTDTSSLSEEDMDFGETDTDNLYDKDSQLERDQSQLSAAIKFKPDHSWIKQHAETLDESDAGDEFTDNQDMPMSESVSVDDAEGIVTAEQPIVSETKTSMEAEDTNSSEIPPDTTPSVADDITDTANASPTGVELGVRCHYIKENIPWNPGTVKKQLQDFEGKTKEVQEDTDSGNEEEVKVDPVATDFKVSEDAAPAEKVTGTPVNCNTTEQDKVDPEVEDKPPLKRSASVYEIEDITLPAGIVKKTTQEIEDRNLQSDSSPESPHQPLQRSSSLKEERVTPKRKRSERRKTCTPIVTPSPSPTATPGSTPRSSHDTTPSGENREFVFPLKKEAKSSDEGQTTETGESQGEDVAVYKWGTEEVPVEKGIVKKQKMDIEQKARDRQTSESRTPDSDKDVEGIILSNKADDTKDISGAFKCKPTVPTSIDIPKVTDTGNRGQVHSGKDDTQNFLKASTSQLSTSPVSSRDSVSPSSPLVRKKHKTSVDLDDSGRFDSETLELIREIGSAFLNSPAKTEKEKEISEQEALEGGSLVKFLVRNIEKTTGVTKKSHLKEIVIIEKDTAAAQQEKKKRLWRYSNPAVEPLTPPGDRPRVTHSHSSPALDVPAKHKDGTVPPGGALTPSSPLKVDPSLFRITADTTNTQSTTSVIEPKETPENNAEGTVKEKVKDLVGKFELPETVNTPGLKEVTPTEEELTIVLKEIDNSKSTNTKSPVSTESDKVDRLSSTSESDATTPEEEDLEGEQSMSEQSIQLRHLRQNLRKANDRPKSAEHMRRSNSTTPEGATPQRPRLRHANTLPSPVEFGPSTFSWEGKKVRKLHGKSHPLTKLETRRASPFYNTM
ncbi:protein phosphatase Slingshot homolog 1-like isoform X2 [Mizuhopecten yessoensis]|uniref:protein phosphatase Slingshot homolog 1-like isoform X2 n=1 Tax=Mizuhopecten yessoensis TaxID=6573 RepID=UPI000B459A89|nr:protein phosphatase Slingshot homolog 1-like isoform X2 [Mizuhopecten yessoensis]